MEFRSQNKQFRSKDPSYVHDRVYEEWSIYFDFEDFKKFKKEYPEFLDWLDSPEDHINELLKADAESNKAKVEWDTFADYHNDVMAFIDLTQAQIRSLMTMI